jgi:uncharacterized protein (DUF427 family)
MGEHVIEVTPAQGRVVVQVGGEVVADSTRALLLTETGCPPRYYLPTDDVKTELLTATDTTSHCPFKGDAVYWSATAGGQTVDDVVWSYPEPKERVADVAGLLAFWQEKPGVELAV